MKISAIFYGAGFPLPLIVLLLAVCCRLPPAASGCWVVPELAAQRQRRRRFVPTTTSPAPPSSDESSSRYNDKSGGGGSSASRPSIRIPFLGRDVVEGGRYALHLEATSLIGGPSWLPIHGKVVLVDRRKSSSSAGTTTTTGGGAGDGAYSTESRYEFDFIPVDPKNPKTMGRLVSLRRTPGQIRLKKLPDMTKTVINPAGDGNAKRGEEEEGGRRLAAAFLAKIRDRLRNSSSAAAAAAAAASLVGGADAEAFSCPTFERANDFCRTYPDRNLHLLFNNCWTFAYRMLVHLNEVEEGRTSKAAAAGPSTRRRRRPS